MKTRRTRLVILCLGIAAFSFWQFLGANEPQHKGKSVSFWVEQACRTGDEEDRQEVLTIGTAAIPYLRNKLKIQETRIDRIVYSTRDHLPDWLEDLLPDRTFAVSLRDNAAACLVRFGPQAAPAIPELIVLLDTKSGNVDRAAVALAAIGPAAKTALPGLYSALTNQKSIEGVEVAWAIWKIGRETNLVLNTLIHGITQTNDSGLVVNSTLALSSLGGAAVSASPALVQILTNAAAAPGARGNAAMALGEVNATDDACIAALRAGLQDPDLSIQANCAVALWQINATNASIALPLMAARLAQWTALYQKTRMNLYDWAVQRHLNLKAAVPELKALLQNNTPGVRQLAQEALDKLNSEKPVVKHQP